MNNDNSILITEAEFGKVIEWLNRRLTQMKVPEKEINRAYLIVEEVFFSFIQSAGADNLTAKLTLQKSLGSIKLRLSARGEALNPLAFPDDEGDDSEYHYRMVILKAMRHYITYIRRGNENVVIINVHKSMSNQVWHTLAGLAVGLLLGLVLRLTADSSVQEWITYNVLESLQTIFMNALMLIVTPMIFFSVMTGVSTMSDATYIKRIGGKLVAWSLLKLSLYIVAGLCAGRVIGIMPDLLAVTPQDGTAEAATLSIRNLIIGIVPGNVITPFSSSDILQTLFLALLFGVMVSRYGERAAWVRSGLDFMSQLTIDVMGFISKCIPAIVTVSMTKLAMQTSISVLFSYGGMVILSALMLPLSLLVGSLLVALFGRMSPKAWLKLMSRFSVVPFSMSDSSASMPATMKLCTDQLNLKAEYVKFAIPMGMQLNMTGTAFYVSVITMVVVQTFGISLSLDFLLSLFVAELFLALTGVGILAMPSLLASMGIPPDVIMFFIGIEPLLDMPGTAQSVTENVNTAYLVGCHEH